MPINRLIAFLSYFKHFTLKLRLGRNGLLTWKKERKLVFLRAQNYLPKKLLS